MLWETEWSLQWALDGRGGDRMDRRIAWLLMTSAEVTERKRHARGFKSLAPDTENQSACNLALKNCGEFEPKGKYS